jgi:hypothetical protein
LKTFENLPASYGLEKELKREVKGAKSAIKARIREVQRQSIADALRLSVLSCDQDDGEERRAGEIVTGVRWAGYVEGAGL